MKNFIKLSISIVLLFFSFSCNKDTDENSNNNYNNPNNPNNPPVVTCDGTLRFENYSSNPYSVTINYGHVFRMEGRTYGEISGFDKGDYVVDVKQLSGYLIYPTEERYNVNLPCNGKALFQFPSSMVKTELDSMKYVKI